MSAAVRCPPQDLSALRPSGGGASAKRAKGADGAATPGAASGAGASGSAVAGAAAAAAAAGSKRPRALAGDSDDEAEDDDSDDYAPPGAGGASTSAAAAKGTGKQQQQQQGAAAAADSASVVLTSTSKLQALLGELAAMRAADPTSKALVFSQFTTTIEWLKSALTANGFGCAAYYLLLYSQPPSGHSSALALVCCFVLCA